MAVKHKILGLVLDTILQILVISIIRMATHTVELLWYEIMNCFSFGQNNGSFLRKGQCFYSATIVTTLIEINMSTHEKTGQYYKYIHSGIICL